MTPVREHGIGSSPTPANVQPRRAFRVNWNAAGVVVAIAIALLTFFRDSAVDFAREFDAIRQRVTVIETLRGEDSKRLQRIEDKIDQLGGFKK